MATKKEPWNKGKNVQILHALKKKLVPIGTVEPLTSQGVTAELIAKVNEIIEILNAIS